MQRREFVLGSLATPLVVAQTAVTAPALAQPAVGNSGATALSRTAILASPPAPGSLLVAMGGMPVASVNVAPNTNWHTGSVIAGTNWALAVYYKIAGASETAAQTPWSAVFPRLGFALWEITGQAAVQTVSGKTIPPFDAKSFVSLTQANAVSHDALVPGVSGGLALAAGIGVNSTSGAVVTGGWTTDLTLGTQASSMLFCHLSGLTAGVAVTPRFAWASAVVRDEWLSTVLCILPGP